jgi:hypothetical protein
MADYSDWPVEADGQLLLDSCAVTTRLTTDDFTARFGRLRAAVAARIFRRTHRQFVAGATDEERFYDGTGAAEQEVDEMVSLTSVQVIGLQSDPGYTLDNTLLVQEQALPRTRIIVAQGSLPAYATNAAFLPYRTIFPVGRQNIKVTGQFGFAATIPEDLWEGCCGEIMYLMSQEVLFRPIGRVQTLKTGDNSTTYHLDSAAITRWHDGFVQALKDYRRPPGRRLRAMAPRMI